MSSDAPVLEASAAHVFVDDLGEPHVAEADAHHLARVLRLRPGEVVTASDGAGRWRRCLWKGAGCSLATDGPVVVVERLEPAVTVGFALTKGDRPERVVRGLTEVGVDRVIPLAAARSVVRWLPERAEAHIAGLRRVAREAAMQSRRVWLPDVVPLVRVVDLLACDGVAEGAALAQPGGAPPSLDRPCILVGPEGGWDTSELAFGLPPVGLGPSIMRSETATVAAGTILCALRAGIVSSSGSPS
jgi:16S rRNA (uracil1498-N3)-methyltransferase